MAIDWAAIERDYRTGEWSDRELAKKYGFVAHGQVNAGVSAQAIGKRARRDGWERNLAKSVRNRAQARMVLDPAEKLSEEEAVEKAVQHRVGILKQHQDNLVALREEAERMLRIVKKRGVALEAQVWPLSDAQAKNYADLVQTAERAVSRLQEAERIALDVQLSVEGTAGDQPGEDLDALTDAERRRRIAKFFEE